MKVQLHSLVELCIRLRFTLLLSALVVLLALGGAYGWKVYAHRQSPEYALANLKNALLPFKPEPLAKMVDFRALSENLARQIFAQRPATPASGRTSAESVSLMAEAVQRVLLEALEQARSADAKPRKIAADAPLDPLPDNFIAQLAGGLTLQSRQDNVAFLRVEVQYPRAERSFPLILQMEKKPGLGWMVTRLANAAEVVQEFTAAEASLQRQRDEAFAEKNASEQRLMDAQLGITSCTVRAEMLSDKKTALLTMEVMGRNTGRNTIHNLNLIAAIGGAGVEVHRHINMAQRITPGEQFSYTWNVDLTPEKPEDAALLAAPALHCTARPRAMALSSGELLYLREKTPPAPPQPASR